MPALWMAHYLINYLLPSLRDGKSDFEQRKRREQPLCGEESLRLLTPKSPEGDFARRLYCDWE